MRFDERLKAQGSKVELAEGYGLTETVTGCVLTPPGLYRKGAIGIPMPDMLAKVVDMETKKELPYGEIGEIALSGPTLMMEYINNPEETGKAIRTDENGISWLTPATSALWMKTAISISRAGRSACSRYPA